MGDMASFLNGVDDWVETKPGEKMFYLNEGYFLLGEIISRVSGKPYERYVSDEIFGPLNMKRSFFTKEEISADTDLSTPYVIKDQKVRPSVVPYGVGAAGGMVSNVVDLSNYVKMLINRGEFDGKRIVSRETLEKMERPYAKWPLEHYGGDSYGYGLEVIPDFHGHKVVGHGGLVDVYTANFSYVHDLKAGSVLLANGTGYSMSVLGMSAIALLMGKNPEDLLPVSTELLLKKLEGQYRAYKDTVFAEVKRNGSFLMLSGDDIGTNIVLVPEKPDADGATFFTLDDGAKMEVRFRFNKHGIELLFDPYKYRKVGPL